MATPAKIVDLNLPTVALVGKVNVGKSTLFNKILDRHLAIISSIAGTTRTRNIGIASWRGKNFQIIDTGGLTFDSSVPLEDDIIHQTEIAISEADVIIFVTDIQEDTMIQERELAKKLQAIAKEKKKKIIFVANKADTGTLRARVSDHDLLKLRLGEPLAVSALNGANLGDLMDVIYSYLNKLSRRPKVIKEKRPIKVALVGKPNVGKSSLFNKLIGEDRVIVSDMPHTTREPHDTLVEFENTPISFIDTAGIRRKTKVSGDLEKQGIGKSLDMINKSDIVLIVLDATEPITDQDQQLAGLLREHTKSVIIVVNKWDTAEENDDAFRNDVKTLINKSFPHLDFAPILFVSAKNGYRVHQIFPLILEAWQARQIELAPEVIHDFIKRSVKKHLPTRGQGVRHPEILGMSQLRTDPPMFEILIKPKTSVHISYIHFLENRLRAQFGFFAVPIIIKMSKMKK
ncbi:MAG: ribosome biogenesis GTPase Der [Candidatus Magasanikbacteria bacterium]